jgi:hypothetical protein
VQPGERLDLDPTGVVWSLVDGEVIDLDDARRRFDQAWATRLVATRYAASVEAIADRLDLLIESGAATSDLPSTAQPLVALARMRVQVLAEGAMFGWATSPIAPGSTLPEAWRWRSDPTPTGRSSCAERLPACPRTWPSGSTLPTPPTNRSSTPPGRRRCAAS